MQFPWVAVYWRKRLSHRQSPSSDGARFLLHTLLNQSEWGCHRLLCWQIRCFIKSTGVFSYLPSYEPNLVWFGSSSDLVCWVFKCTGKGPLFAPNKSGLGFAFLMCVSVKEARQQLKYNELLSSPRERKGITKLKLCIIWGSSLSCRGNFFSVFAANMFKFALFWRQVVNASEVYTWHMFLFTRCPPFVSCSRCSVYHFKCILIY